MQNQDQQIVAGANGLVCVVGYGHAGKRHARLLRGLGYEVVVFDNAPCAIDQAQRNGYETHSIKDWLDELWRRCTDAVHIASLRGVVVACSPSLQAFTVQWVAQEFGCPIFVEKPFTLPKGEACNAFLRSVGNPYRIAVGHQLRADLELQRLASSTQKTAAVNVSIYDHQCMASWPAATYQRNLVEEFSHEIDLASWLFGPFVSVQAHWCGVKKFVARLTNERRQLVTLSIDGGAHQLTYKRGVDLFDATGTDRLDGWKFNKDQNEANYAHQLKAWLDGHPFCTLADHIETDRLMRRIQTALEHSQEVQ